MDTQAVEAVGAPSASGDVVSYRFRTGVARIALTAPDRGNPINQPLLDALFSAVRRAGADGAKVIVLNATGRLFSVGGDISAFGAADVIEEYVDDLADSAHRVVSELIHSPAVVVAGVQGMAAGAAFPLVAAADLVVATRSAGFMLGYTKLGFSIDGGTSLLVQTLGLHRMLRLALLNDVLSAAEAQQAGLVARVVEDGDLDGELESMAAALAAGPGGAQATTKRLLRSAAVSASETLMRREALAIREHAADEDGTEGVRAFVEKRSPRFGH